MAEPPLPSGVAVDFGGTKIAASRVSSGRIVGSVRTSTDGDASAERQIEAICGLLSALNLEPGDPVGVAVAGRVDADGVWHALNTETLTRVQAVPLRDMLSDRLDRTVNVQNDAIAAAVGEHLAGAGRGAARFGFITVSTGVGGGIVLDGRPVVSPSGLAGHVGFTTSRLSAGRCGSGRVGTVENVAGGRAIAAAAARRGHPGYDAKRVFEAHLAGEIWASELIARSAQAVAELCANLAAILDLQRIVLGGSIGLAAGYSALVSAALADEPKLFCPEIVHAELGQEAALIGILSHLV
jgi:N-acylmannosamine kinase